MPPKRDLSICAALVCMNFKRARTYRYAKSFLRATARSAKRALAIVILSARLSRPGTGSSPGEIETPGLYYMMA